MENEVKETMTEEEFTKKALEKGFDIEWITSSIAEYKEEFENDEKNNIFHFPLECHLYSLYEGWVKYGMPIIESSPLMPPVKDIIA